MEERGIFGTIMFGIITIIFVVIIVLVLCVLYFIVKYSLVVLKAKFYGLQDSWEQDPSRYYTSPTHVSDSVTAIPLRWRA